MNFLVVFVRIEILLSPILRFKWLIR
ncbi:hypothetical protein TSAR_015015 [Trichomalopsis sarcophagae]|uniref:Uncharacterized protein n=1 Tax=Trichomalopsis sarcophagae TaxID=543379 RepID=A0A232EXL1_9HYME|nr:hypothetical protein TSAR_015015 [Trichomalopsis sarcophagae]